MIETPANARSRRTRATVLSAARALLEEKDFRALTMAAVAERAGVTRRAVYLHFASRAELVGALFDHVADQEGLEHSLQQVWDAPNAATALREWARHLASYHVRLLAVDRAVERVSGVDEHAAHHRERVVEAKLASCRHLARRLEEAGQLRDPWTATTMADMLFALTSSDVVQALTADRGWSHTKLAEHLELVLRSTFLNPSGPNKAPA